MYQSIYNLQFGCNARAWIGRVFVSSFFRSTCFTRSYTRTFSRVCSYYSTFSSALRKTNRHKKPWIGSMKLDNLYIALRSLCEWMLHKSTFKSPLHAVFNKPATFSMIADALPLQMNLRQALPPTLDNHLPHAIQPVQSYFIWYSFVGFVPFAHRTSTLLPL